MKSAVAWDCFGNSLPNDSETKRMRSYLLAVGFILIAAGIIAALITTSKSKVWLNESFTVQPLSYNYYYGTFSSATTLHVRFSVGGGDVAFRVMDETNFLKWKAGSSCQYYTAPSRDTISSMDLDWTPPSSSKIYFVWDNTGNLFISKAVDAYFYYNSTGNEYRLAGIGLIIAGLSIAVLGTVPRSKTKEQPPPTSHP